jgi:outer membrane protein OmpA-like peptidoglycan-associated protein
MLDDREQLAPVNEGLIMNTWIKKLRSPAAVVAITCFFTQPSSAAAADAPRASKQENIGVATGLAVGAVAGGPVGAIFGAAAGAWLGDRYHKQNEARALIASDLRASEDHSSHLAAEMQRMSTSLADSDAKRAQLEAALERTQELESSVLFRTGTSELEPAALVQVAKLGALVAGLPDVTVHLSGYADPRGTEAFNLALSQRRAESVKTALQNAGVDANRMVVEGLGAADDCGDEDDLDIDALERRVDIHLERAGVPAVAQRE